MCTLTTLSEFSRGMRGTRAEGGVSPETALVAFLALVADRKGFSFFRDEQIYEILGISAKELRTAREKLQASKLIVFVPRCPQAPHGYYRVHK